MKAMKKLMIVAATLTLSSAAFYAVACGEDHEHQYSWSTTTEATCDTDGEEKGVCEVCGEETTRPISAKGHSYGNWFVSAPSQDKAGKAIRVCATDGSHQDGVDLPVLPKSGNGEYKSVTPVAGSDYASTYVYDHNGMEISFKGYSFDKTDIAAAVTVAGETNSNAINSKATHYNNTHAINAESTSSVNMEFGAGYVHIVDNTQNQEMWYEKQPDGTSFNALKFYDRLNNQSVKLDMRDDAMKMYDGYGYYFVWVYSDHYDYGVGNFINYYYNQAANNENGDFTQSYEEVDGKTVYKFSYGLYDSTYYSEYAGGDHLNIMSFEFTLASNGVVEKLVATNKTYTNTKDTQGQDDAGNIVNLKGETNFTQNDDGKWRLVENASVANTESWTITQKTSLDAGETLPTTPYHYEDMLASSFDLMKVRVNGNFEITQVLGPIEEEITSEATTPIYMGISNVAPSTANFYIDDIRFYLRTIDEDGKPVDTRLSEHYADGEDWHIKASYDPVTSVLVINPCVAGDHTLVIKTKNVEKILTIHVPYSNPTSISASVYDYDVETETFKWDNLNSYFKIYAGEELYFKSRVGHPAYQDGSYTAAATGRVDVELGSSIIMGEEVSVFKATEAGLYTVTVTSSANSALNYSFKVRVLPVPNEAKLLSNVYHGVDADKNAVSVEFDTEGKTAKIQIGENGSVYNATLNYTYTAASDDSTPTLVVANDPESDYTFTFEVTSSYEVLLRYKSEFGEVNRVYISNAVKNAITGTYSLSANHNQHTANVSEYYAISATTTFFYSINGEMATDEATGGAISVSTLQLELEEGDVLELWSMRNGSYKLTVNNPVASIEIDEPKSKEIFVGGATLPLDVIYTGINPDGDVSFEKSTWSSSDTSIATVSAAGVVTAVAPGTVTITATSTDNPEATASIVLTVTYIKATSVTLNKTEAEMKIGGDALTLVATVGAENASSKKVVWTSSDESIATVSSSGKVTVNSELSADTTVTITATSVDSTDENPLVATCTITVKYIAPTSITLNKETENMVVGGATLKLTATVGGQDASNKKVIWTSSDSNIATVSESGVVTVNPDLTADGTVTITATSAADSTLKKTCTITVKYTAPTQVTLNKTAATVSVGGTTNLTATVTGADNAAASNTKVNWTSSNPDVVSVDANGVVTVNADYRTNGTEVTITATSVADNTVSATCVITVKYVAIATFEVASGYETAYTMNVGETETVILNVKDASNTTGYTIKGITWESDNENVTVQPRNNTTYITTAYIYVSDELRESIVAHVTATSADNPEKKVIITITVNYVAVTGLTLDKTTADMTVGGDTLKLVPTVNPEGASVTDVTWTSSDTSIATVNGLGVVTVSDSVKANTTVTITATSVDNPELSAECVISITYVPVTGVTVANESLTLKVGEGFSSNASVAPENASIKSLNYSSSDKKIVTVDENGEITAVKVGTATITVTSAADNTKTATYSVTVTAATVSEGANTLSIKTNDTVIYEFTGEPNTAYTFTLGKTVSGYMVNKDHYAWDGTYKLKGMTDENGKFTVAVSTPYNHYNYTLLLTVDKFVAPVGGDGSMDFPYDLILGKTYSYNNVGYYAGPAGKLVIEEEGDYLVSGSGVILKIGGTFDSYGGACAIWSPEYTCNANGTVHLAAGTYNVSICGNDSWGNVNVSFNITKV